MSDRRVSITTDSASGENPMLGKTGGAAGFAENTATNGASPSQQSPASRRTSNWKQKRTEAAVFRKSVQHTSITRAKAGYLLKRSNGLVGHSRTGAARSQHASARSANTHGRIRWAHGSSASSRRPGTT